jgi:ATPase subunit of ABC transporter with duplicated ATPase domains
VNWPRRRAPSAPKGEVGYLPQALTLGVETTVGELLGIADIVGALHAVESGDGTAAHYEAVGDDWDIESRAQETMHEIGLSAIDLDRRVGSISGGEAMLVAIAGLRVRRSLITPGGRQPRHHPA